MISAKLLNVTCAVLIFGILNSCNSENTTDKDRKITYKTNNNDDLFYNLLLLAKEYKLPTDNSCVVLVPPTNCIACQLGALNILNSDSLSNCYILQNYGDSCLKKQNTQICIEYKFHFLKQNKLVKGYSVYFKIVNNQVKAYKPL